MRNRNRREVESKETSWRRGSSSLFSGWSTASAFSMNTLVGLGRVNQASRRLVWLDFAWSTAICEAKRRTGSGWVSQKLNVCMWLLRSAFVIKIHEKLNLSKASKAVLRRRKRRKEYVPMQVAQRALSLPSAYRTLNWGIDLHWGLFVESVEK